MLAIEETISPTKEDAAEPKITFSQADLASPGPNLDDLVVISIQTGEFFAMQPSSGELVGFSRERVSIKGYIWLRTTMGNTPLSKTIDIQYLIVDCPSPYNIILRRPALNTFKAVCYNASLKGANIEKKPRQEVKAIHSTNEVLSLAELDPREDFQERPQPVDDLQRVPLTAKAGQFTYIGRALEGEERSKLIKVLQDNADLFTWTSADMPGINPSVICHKLAIDRTIRSVAQKKRNLGAEKVKATLEETKKLLNASFIKEIRFTTWLSNVVMTMLPGSKA
ncbi:uncharacterized protein [Arachis hypogaea]|uniref:uncharacterized protein n=1 Tax=Arachis hypogaea TaxID=3818 RepID=UPI003B22858F